MNYNFISNKFKHFTWFFYRNVKNFVALSNSNINIKQPYSRVHNVMNDSCIDLTLAVDKFVLDENVLVKMNASANIFILNLTFQFTQPDRLTRVNLLSDSRKQTTLTKLKIQILNLGLWHYINVKNILIYLVKIRPKGLIVSNAIRTTHSTFIHAKIWLKA